MSAVRILLLDDEPNVLRAIERLLSGVGYTVNTFDTADRALASVHVIDYHVVISDYRMPKMNGVELLEHLQEVAPTIPRIMLTSGIEPSVIGHTINRAGVFRFLEKPYDSVELLDAVRDAISLQKKNARVSEALDRLSAELSARDHERRIVLALEREDPGITEVNWSDDYTIVLEDSWDQTETIVT